MGHIVGKVFAPSAKYACRYCGKEFKAESALKKHVAKEHPPTSDGVESVVITEDK